MLNKTNLKIQPHGRVGVRNIQPGGRKVCQWKPF